MGTKLADKIVIGRVMGKGGFGITYIGYDVRMEKIIAVKEYFPNGIAYRSHLGTEVSVADAKSSEAFEKGAEKFYAEAQMVAQFNGNPNIVSVYDYFRANNTVYLVMEYLRGMTLKNYIKKHGKLSDGQALFIMDKIAAALSITHSAGVLHRDISPDNIMICTDGKVKLIDFGAARQIMAESSSNLTVVMKPGYTPIEQYTKKGVQGAWTDIYSLGVSVYYALTETIIDDPYARMDDDSEFAENKHGINNDLWTILKKCTMISAHDRFGSAIDLRKALSSVSAPIKSEPIALSEDELRADESGASDEAVSIALDNTVSPEENKPQNDFPVTAAVESVHESAEISENKNSDDGNMVGSAVTADNAVTNEQAVANGSNGAKVKRGRKKAPIIIAAACAAVVMGAAGIFAAVKNSDSGTIAANSGETAEISTAFSDDVTESTAAVTEKTKNETASVRETKPKKKAETVRIDDDDLTWSMTRSIPIGTFEAFGGDILVTLELNEHDIAMDYDDEGNGFYYYSVRVVNENSSSVYIEPIDASMNEYNEIILDEGQTELAFVLPHKSLKFIKDRIMFETHNALIKAVTLEEYKDIGTDKIVEFSGEYPGDWQQSEFISVSDLQDIGGDVRITLDIEADTFGNKDEEYYLLRPVNENWEPVEVSAVDLSPNDEMWYELLEKGQRQLVFTISKEEIAALTKKGLSFQLHNIIITSAALESAEQ